MIQTWHEWTPGEDRAAARQQAHDAGTRGETKRGIYLPLTVVPALAESHVEHQLCADCGGQVDVGRIHSDPAAAEAFLRGQ